MKKIPILAALILLLISLTTAEEWMSFTTDDGLAHDICRCVAVDHDGNVWVGSADYITGFGGVSMWDGETWTTYNSWTTDFALRSNCINDIAVDQENNIWFATGTILFPGGLTKYNGESWERFDFDTLRPDTSEVPIELWVDAVAAAQNGELYFSIPGFLGIYADTFTFMHDSLFFDISISEIEIDGDVYFGGHHGSAIFTGSEFIPIYLSGYIKGLSISTDRIWFADFHFGVYSFDDTSVVNYDTTDGLLDMVTASVFQYNMKLWVGSETALWTMDLDDSGGFERIVHPDSPSRFVLDISIDKNENLLFATLDGFFIYNYDSIIWSISEVNETVSENPIRYYPNPFSTSLSFKYNKSRKEVYDIHGRKMDTIDEGQDTWYPDRDLSSGIYLIKSQHGSKIMVKKVNLMR